MGSFRFLQEFGDGIWIADGPPVQFHGFAYPVRMTIVELPDGGLFVHSPIAPEEGLREEVATLGDVRCLVSPNKIHHLYLGDWKRIFPKAGLYASPGLRRRRRDLTFDADLGEQAEPEWRGHIDQLVFSGSFFMEEVVFFHRLSKTLILADLIEYFPPGHFSGVQKSCAGLAGILSPDGKAPIDWRITFWNRARARQCFRQMRAWMPEKIILAHGNCYVKNAGEELERAFQWLRVTP